MSSEIIPQPGGAEDPLGEMWNRSRHGFPVPKMTTIKSAAITPDQLQETWQQFSIIMRNLTLSNIEARVDKSLLDPDKQDGGFNVLLMVPPDFARKARQVLNI